jgi:hypothetical protein
VFGVLPALAFNIHLADVVPERVIRGRRDGHSLIHRLPGLTSGWSLEGEG